MGSSSLPAIALYILLVPILFVLIAHWIDMRSQYRPKLSLDDPDEPVRFWPYIGLCFRWTWNRHAAKEIAVEVAITAASVSIGFISGGGWAALGVGVVALIAIFLVGISTASHEIHERQRSERSRLRDKHIHSLFELKALRKHILEMRDEKVRDDPDFGNTSVWVNAGQDLIQSREHGVIRDSKYAALRSILNAAEKGQHAWQEDIDEETGKRLPLLYGVFRTFVSHWDEEIKKRKLKKHGDFLRAGLEKFVDVLDERIIELEAKPLDA